MWALTLLAATVAADAFGGLDGSGVAWGNMTFFLPAMNARLEAVSRAMHYNGTAGGPDSSSACYGLYADLASAVPLNESLAAKANETMLYECIRPLAKYHVAQGRWSGLLFPANDTIALLPTLLDRPRNKLSDQGGESSMSSTYTAALSGSSAMTGSYMSSTYTAGYSGSTAMSESNVSSASTLSTAGGSSAAESQGGSTVVETVSAMVGAARRALGQMTDTFATATGIFGSSVSSSYSGASFSYNGASSSYSGASGTYSGAASGTYSSAATGTYSSTQSSAPTQNAVLVVNATTNLTTVQGGGNSTAVVLAGYSFLWGQIYVIDQVLVPPMPLNDTLASLGFDPTLNATGWRDLSQDVTAFYSESRGNTTVCVGEAVFVNSTVGKTDLQTEKGDMATLDASDAASARFDDAQIVRANIPLANGVLHLVE